MCVPSCVQLFGTPWPARLLCPWYFQKRNWSGLPFPTPGDLLHPRNWTCVLCILCLFRFTILMSRQLYVIVLICISLLVTWNIFSCLLAIYSFLFCELSAFCAHFSTICLSFKIFLVRILYTFWIVILFLQYMLKTVFLISCVISFTQCFSSVNIFLILAVKSVHFFPLRSGSHSPYQNYTTILQFSNTFRILSPIYFL